MSLILVFLGQNYRFRASSIEQRYANSRWKKEKPIKSIDRHMRGKETGDDTKNGGNIREGKKSMVHRTPLIYLEMGT